MPDKPMRRTQARVLERERRRQQQIRKQKLIKIIPLGILGAVILLALGYWAFTTFTEAAATQGGTPTLALDKEKIDLGDQKLGQTVHASFNVKNSGTGRLSLNVPSSPQVLEGC